MSAAPEPGGAAGAGLDRVARALERDRAVALPLPGSGVLYLDRRLPFLVVYRRPPDREDLAASRLVTGEAAYAVLDGSDPAAAEALLGGVVRLVGAHFPRVLLVEVWTRAESAAEAARAEEEGEEEGAVVPGEAPPPRFRVVAGGVPEVAAELAGALGEMALDGRPARVLRSEGEPAPPGLAPLCAAADDDALARLGVEVAPVFRRGPGGALYPPRLDELRRLWHRALGRALFAFCRREARTAVVHPLALGRRELPQALGEIDRRLAEVGETFDYLLELTPVNAAEAWHEFRASGHRHTPHFRYRPVTVDVELLKRRLYDVPLEGIEDPTLTALFRGKQEELDRQITLLVDRGTERFFHGSMALYGPVDDDLTAVARQVLARHPPGGSGPAGKRMLGAAGFAARARREVDHYRRVLPGLPDLVEVRDDMYAGVMVSRGRLLVGRDFRVSRHRAEALVHHEVGTHVVTYLNGRAQGFHQLHLGFAGYEALQEGLAVLAEYLVGGLTGSRLRMLAGRVLAVQARADGARFAEAWDLLTAGHGFSPDTAFTLLFRVWRGGGFTKDKVYLEGLRDLLAYLAGGGKLEPLYVGKVAAEHVPIVRELELRGVLGPRPLTPRFLHEPASEARLRRLRAGLAVADLVDEESVTP